MAKSQTNGQAGAFDFTPFTNLFDPKAFDPKMFGGDAFAKAFAPKFDFGALAQAQQKNFEAFAAAQRVLIEGAQVVGQRQAELAREAFDQGSQAINQIVAAGTPAEKVAAQLAVAKSTYEKSVAGAEELGKLSAETNQKASKVIAQRLSETLDEVAQQVEAAKAA